MTFGRSCAFLSLRLRPGEELISLFLLGRNVPLGSVSSEVFHLFQGRAARARVVEQRCEGVAAPGAGVGGFDPAEVAGSVSCATIGPQGRHAT